MLRLSEYSNFQARICGICLALLVLLTSLASPFQNTCFKQLANSTKQNQVCESITIESKSDMWQLCECVVVDGSIKIQHFNQKGEALDEESFPMLREVREFILIYKVPGPITLKKLFPNLFIVRGEKLISRYSIIVHEVHDLSDSWFPSLRIIERGFIFINGKEWVPNIDKCSEGHNSMLNMTEAARSERYHQGPINEYSCSSDKIGDCSSECPVNCDISGRCCHPECLGGCHSPMNVSSCFSCRNVVDDSQCRRSCSDSTYQVNRRCVSRDFCTKRNLLVLDQKRLCLSGSLCPTGYKRVNSSLNGKTESLCNQCEKGESCPKICPGILIESIDQISKLEGCEIIDGALSINVNERGLSSHILESSLSSLGSLKEIRGFLHIFQTPTMSLDFLKRLERIKGNILHEKRNAIRIENNPELESIFTNYKIEKNIQMNIKNRQLTIENGDILFISNPRLCPNRIWSFVNTCSGPNITNLNRVFYQQRHEVMVFLNGTFDSDRWQITPHDNYKGGITPRGSYNGEIAPLNKGKTVGNLQINDSSVHNTLSGQLLQQMKTDVQQHFSITNTTNGFSGPCNVLNLNVSIKPSINRGSLEIYHEKLENFQFSSPVSFLVFYKKRDASSDKLKVDFLSTCLEEWSSIGPVLNESDPNDKTVIYISDLDSYTKYVFLIIGFPINKDGNVMKAQSQILHTLTPVYNPSPPVNVEFVSKTPFTLDVRWGPPDHPNGIIDHYVVSIMNIKIALTNNVRNYDDSSTIAQGKMDILRQFMLNQTDSFANPKKDQSITNCSEFGKTIESSPVARQPSCFCNLDNINNENEKITSRCNATNKLINDQEMANNKPFAVQHREQSRNEDERQERLVYGTQTSFENLKHSGLYRIQVTACQKPVSCSSSFSSISCNSAEDKPQRESNNEPQKFPLYKLCSLHSEVRMAVVKGSESLSMNLEAKNHTKENETGIELFWSPPQDIPSSGVLAYYVEIRNDTTLNILRRRYVRHSFELTHQSAAFKDLITGYYSAKVSAVNMDKALSVTKWVSFYYLDEKNKHEIIMTKVLKVIIAIEILIAIFGYVAWRRFKSKRSFGSVDSLYKGAVTDSSTLSVQFKEDVKLSINQLEIHYNNLLGRGHFGDIFEGSFTAGEGEPTKVAVKIPNKNSKPVDLERFMKEPAIMQNLSSHHVVKLIGVVLDNSPFMFVMEFMTNKDLKTFFGSLKNQANAILTRPILIRMACEAADGMAYLSSLHIVHKDVAARNCLVSDTLHLKICDLGIAGHLQPNEEVSQYLPVRWMAPESIINKVFTTSSDVWSYGVLLWEISTGCKTPYEDSSHEQVAFLVSSSGSSLPDPNLPISHFQTLMMKCWNLDASKRPTFLAIFKYLIQFVEIGERASLEAVSSCYNQQKAEEKRVTLLMDEKRVSLPNEVDENFYSRQERESGFLRHYAVNTVCNESNRSVGPPSRIPSGPPSAQFHLINNQETPPRTNADLNLTLNMSLRRKYHNAQAQDAFPYSSSSSHYPGDQSLLRISVHSPNTSFVRIPDEDSPSTSSNSRSIPQRISFDVKPCNFFSKNSLSKIDIESLEEKQRLRREAMIEKITEKCATIHSPVLSSPRNSSLSSTRNSSLYELSPYKKIKDVYNQTSSKRRKYPHSDYINDSESSANLISPSEASVSSEVTILKSAMPFFYCQCPYDNTPLISSDKKNLKADYALDSSQNLSNLQISQNLSNLQSSQNLANLQSSQNLSNLHQKHFNPRSESDARRGLLTSEYMNV